MSDTTDDMEYGHAIAEGYREPQRRKTVSDTTALATLPPDEPKRSASWALAQLSDQQFAQQMQMFKKGRDRLQQVMRSMMTADVHFGVIPGTGGKPTLLQPGADLLLKMFNLVAEPTSEITYGDGVTAPHFTIKARCIVHQGDIEGPVVAIGEAAASSWEKKWRYRTSERKCPACGKAAIIKGKAEYGGGWVCFKKKDGCGAKFADGAKEIEGQVGGQVENPDPFELLNTAVKIANKRAKVHAAIAATDSSDLLTQDMEEGHSSHQEPPQEAPAPQPAKTPPPATNGPPKAANAQQPPQDVPLPGGSITMQQQSQLEALITKAYISDPMQESALLASVKATLFTQIPAKYFLLICFMVDCGYNWQSQWEDQGDGWLLKFDEPTIKGAIKKYRNLLAAKQAQASAEEKPIHF